MKALTIILLLFILTSCGRTYGPDYKYETLVKVTYQDNSIDTISVVHESFKGNNVSLYIKTSGSFESTPACLTTHCGMYNYTISCGVRHFEILNESKESIPKQKTFPKPKFKYNP